MTSAVRTEPVCAAGSLDLHWHKDSRYDSEGSLTCGYADFVVYRYDSFCYGENGILWCPLPEIEAHTHADSCYARPEEVHKNLSQVMKNGLILEGGFGRI